jgi:phosphoglycolate phosphatase-like HAD superfamily hydrolase
MLDSIIFDLDGTLWSACEASAKGWTAALQELGYDQTITPSDIGSVTGMPFDDDL